MEGLIKIIIKVVEITSKDLENMKTIISKN